MPWELPASRASRQSSEADPHAGDAPALDGVAVREPWTDFPLAAASDTVQDESTQPDASASWLAPDTAPAIDAWGDEPIGGHVAAYQSPADQQGAGGQGLPGAAGNEDAWTAAYEAEAAALLDGTEEAAEPATYLADEGQLDAVVAARDAAALSDFSMLPTPVMGVQRLDQSALRPAAPTPLGASIVPTDPLLAAATQFESEGVVASRYESQAGSSAAGAREELAVEHRARLASALERIAARVRSGELEVGSAPLRGDDAAALASVLASLLGARS
jgi:hypothetical protein